MGFEKGHPLYSGSEKGWFKKGQLPCNKGVPMKEGSKHKLSLTKMGLAPWNKGLTIDDSRVKLNIEKASLTNRNNIASGKFNPTKNFGLYAIKGEAPPAWNKGKPIRLNPEGEFKKGHITWNKGLPSEAQPLYGKEKTEETRLKISESLMGHSVPKEVRTKIALKRLFQVVPVEDTSIERLIQTALEKEGVPFITHYPIIGQPDIAFPEQRVAVFCDGCYWHGCPVCGYKEKKLRRHYVDKYVVRKLEEQGWTVLRFWEHKIKEDVGGCVNHIKEVL